MLIVIKSIEYFYDEKQRDLNFFYGFILISSCQYFLYMRENMRGLLQNSYLCFYGLCPTAGWHPHTNKILAICDMPLPVLSLKSCHVLLVN